MGPPPPAFRARSGSLRKPVLAWSDSGLVWMGCLSREPGLRLLLTHRPGEHPHRPAAAQQTDGSSPHRSAGRLGIPSQSLLTSRLGETRGILHIAGPGHGGRSGAQTKSACLGGSRQGNRTPTHTELGPQCASASWPYPARRDLPASRAHGFPHCSFLHHSLGPPILPQRSGLREALYSPNPRLVVPHIKEGQTHD